DIWTILISVHPIHIGAMQMDSASLLSKVLVASSSILVLCLSTFDWFGIDGVVPLLQKHYSINDAATATIKTSASVVQTTTLAVVWIFGDSFKRRRLFLASVFIWITFSIFSIVLGTSSFMIFVGFRAIAASSSAVFGVLAPVVMADIFQDRALGIALMSLSVSEIVASLLADMVSSWIVTSHLPWQSGMIASSVLSIVPMSILLCVKYTIRNVDKPSKGVKGVVSGAFGVLYIKSYLFMTAAGSFVMFHKKAYTFWFPSMNLLIWSNVPEIFLGLSYTTITVIKSFAMLAGTLTGLPIIMWFAQSWRFGTGLFSRRNEFLSAYPIVVSVGATLSGVMFILSIILADHSYIICLVATFFVGFGGAADSCLGQQIMLMVVPSNSRAAAVALSKLISGIVTIPSAQLVGMVSDAFREDSLLDYDRFRAYQLGLLYTSSFLVAGSICFVAVVFFFSNDYKRVHEIATNGAEPVDENTHLIRNA
ncbi:hypothetical protein PRIPAC_91793, partial [Pristionchus pacificus]